MKFTIAATHKMNVFGESLVVYGPATKGGGCVVIMGCFLHNLLQGASLTGWVRISIPDEHLPFLSKILEKIILRQLLANIDTHNLLSVHQSAYCDGHGTETDLLSIVCRPHCLRIR